MFLKVCEPSALRDGEALLTLTGDAYMAYGTLTCLLEVHGRSSEAVQLQGGGR